MYPTNSTENCPQPVSGPGRTGFLKKKQTIIDLVTIVVVMILAGAAWTSGIMVLGATNRAPSPTTPPESTVRPPVVAAAVEEADDTAPKGSSSPSSTTPRADVATVSTSTGKPHTSDTKPTTAAQANSPSQPSVKSRFPGDPRPSATGKLFWGAAINGNGDPMTRHEQQSGVSLSLRRTFFGWRHHETANSYLYKTVENDIANNRLSWVSTKTPSWREVASGKHDARIDSLLKRLDSYNRPIWLTFHHEPEGGGGVNSPDDPGGAAAWRGMQIRVRERMNALAIKNVAFAPILMSYTWNPASSRSPNDWYVPGIWDFYGVDSYRNTESGDMLSDKGLNNFMTWVNKKNLPVAFGEWGNRGTNSAAANEMQAFLQWGIKNDVVGMAYFDSGLNSPNGSWELRGQQLTKFRAILGSSSVMRVSNLR